VVLLFLYYTLEARFANSAIPSHIQDSFPIPSDGQVPQLSTGAKHPVTEMYGETLILPRGVKIEKIRKGKRHTKSPELVDSDTDSEDLFLRAANYMAPEASFSTSLGSFPFRGSPSPGLRELVPARSDFRVLVSYRTYRLANSDRTYDHSVAKGLSATMKAIG
jgi:hypothetical protein